MIKMRQIMTFVLMAVWAQGAFAIEGDNGLGIHICQARPELCVKATKSVSIRDPKPQPARRGPASVGSSFTFAEYVAENAANPALSRNIADHQTAFVDPPIQTSLLLSDENKNGAAPADPNAVQQPGAVPIGVVQPQSATIPAANTGGFSNSGPIH